MSYLKITHYLGVLLKEGRRWEFSDLLDSKYLLTDRKIKNYSWYKRLILLLPTAMICLLLKNGIDQTSIGYSIAALSIFIGLFSSLIVTLYGRFLNIERLPDDASDLQLIEDKKVKYFIRQFTFVTGKNLLVATIMIAILLIMLIFSDNMSVNVFTLKFISSLDKATCKSFLIGLNAFIAISLRLVIVYLTINFFLSLCYSLGALFAFLKREYK